MHGDGLACYAGSNNGCGPLMPCQALGCSINLLRRLICFCIQQDRRLSPIQQQQGATYILHSTPQVPEIK